MSLIVQKYGGTSVGDVERIKKVAKKIVRAKNAGNKVVVVVSAMGKSTDHLVNLAKEISSNPSQREMDVLLSTGEQISISLLAMAIKSLGSEAISLTGYQCGIETDTFYSKAKINAIHSDRILEELEKDQVVIVAGFQGMSPQGDITTLGRGGSDTSAVAIASALKAKVCEIYTDVDGIYTTDPRLTDKAKRLDYISYDEMLELAKLGANVLHPRSVELARKNKITLKIKSSFNDSKGTTVMEVKDMEKAQVRGVTLDDQIARFSVTRVPDQPGIAFQLFSLLGKHNIAIDMIIQNLNHQSHNDISFTVGLEDVNATQKILKDFIASMPTAKIDIREDVAKLSIVGTGITSDSNIVSSMFGAFYDLGINIQMISTSEIKVSCIIDKAESKLALVKIHDVLNLDTND